MTREEREQALEWFKNRPITMSGAKKMYDLAIAALEQLEPCEDAVSRKTVKELMLKYGFLAPDMTVTEFVEDCLPPVTPKQRIGKWIRNGWAITCSECGYDMPYTVRNFCPNCGAKMEGDAE